MAPMRARTSTAKATPSAVAATGPMRRSTVCPPGKKKTLTSRALIARGSERISAVLSSRPRTPAAAAGTTTASPTIASGPSTPPSTTAPTALTVAALDEPLPLREAGLGAPRHGGQDQVHDEEGGDLVDRVADEALPERCGSDVRPRLAEGGHQEVGAPSRDTPEQVGRDGSADDGRDDAGDEAGDDDVGRRQVTAHEEDHEQTNDGERHQRECQPAENHEDRIGILHRQPDLAAEGWRGPAEVGEPGHADDHSDGDRRAERQLA